MVWTVRGPNAFFDRTYDETMGLLIEARNYVAYTEIRDAAGRPGTVRLKASYQSMRVTSRLTQVMAWLLALKAVHVGELTPEDMLTEQYAISGHRVCAGASGGDDEELPAGLRSLLERSYSLYMRAVRLEDQYRRSSGDETHGSGYAH